MRRLTTLIAGLAAAAVLTACSTLPASTATSSATTASTSVASSVTAAQVLTANEDATTVNDDEWSMDDAVDITLTGSTATTSAKGVTVDGNTVTITAAGVYRLTGTLAGQVVVNAPEDAQVVLVLNGAEITSSSTAAIAVLQADDVGVYLIDGTSNTLADTSSYADDADVNAALFSEADLTISGTGSLMVAGNGNDGITSEDDLVILSGTINRGRRRRPGQGLADRQGRHRHRRGRR